MKKVRQMRVFADLAAQSGSCIPWDKPNCKDHSHKLIGCRRDFSSLLVTSNCLNVGAPKTPRQLLFAAFQGQRGNPVHLIPVENPSVILTPCGLLCVAKQIRSRDVMTDADFGSSQAGEVLLSHVSARAIEAVCLLMVDSFGLETLM
jgi:hypothetical protein